MRRVVTVAIGLLLLAGCGSSKHNPTGEPVSGTITYKGQPVNNATLHLYPTGQGMEAIIHVNSDGTFKEAGLPAGEYKVVVEGDPGDPGPPTAKMTAAQKAEMRDRIESLKRPATIKFPEKYKHKDKTDLKITVPSSGALTLELKD